MFHTWRVVGAEIQVTIRFAIDLRPGHEGEGVSCYSHIGSVFPNFLNLMVGL
jgi:hypothetical protein